MKILGSFLSVEDPNTFFFMRGFADLVSREPMKPKFYEGEFWKSELENVLLPMLENYPPSGVKLRPSERRYKPYIVVLWVRLGTLPARPLPGRFAIRSLTGAEA
jgi:hypothetical protein